MWGQKWVKSNVLALCDNMAVVEITKTHTSKNPSIMHLLWCHHFFTAKWDICLKAEHIPGVSNTVADAISWILCRFSRKRLRKQTRLQLPYSLPYWNWWSQSNRMDPTNLKREGGRLLKRGIAPSTAHTYRMGRTAYTNFCARFNFSLLPSSEDQLILFVADLAQTKAYGTIKVYLVGDVSSVVWV